MTKRKFIFDVDGVLCDRGQLIDNKFEQWMHEWLRDKDYYLVTGSPRDKVIKQIGMSIATNPKIGFHCCGNSIWLDGKETQINQIHLTNQEKEHALNFFKASTYENKQLFIEDEILQHRNGSISYSTIKRGVSVDERQAYVKFDKEYNERKNLIIQFNNMFPRLELFLGGDTSVDIVLRGAHKGQVLDYIDDSESEIHFFGDRIGEYGIDRPLAELLVWHDRFHVHEITYGYNQTWGILKNL